MSAYEGSKMQEQWEDGRKERERKEEEKRRKEDQGKSGIRQVVTVKKQSEMPAAKHWAIVKYKEHGTSTEDAIEYRAYLVKEDWEAAIREMEESFVRERYTALEVKPAAVKRTITVGIE